MHPKKNSEGACGKMLHSTACCVCVWHPSIKIKSKLTEHIKKTTRKLNFTRNGISYSCCGLLFQFFMVCIAWIYGKNTHHSHLYGFDEKYALKKSMIFGNSCFPIESINRARCTFLGRERVTWYCVKVTFLLTLLNPQNHGRKIDKIYVREFVIALFEPSFITFDK